jgi:hypothetical protein
MVTLCVAYLGVSPPRYTSHFRSLTNRELMFSVTIPCRGTEYGAWGNLPSHILRLNDYFKSSGQPRKSLFQTNGPPSSLDRIADPAKAPPSLGSTGVTCCSEERNPPYSLLPSQPAVLEVHD